MKRPANAPLFRLTVGFPPVLNFVLVASLALGLSACDSDLQQQLDDKRAGRYKAASDAVAAIEAERIEALEAKLPKEDAPPVGKKPAIMEWRAALFAADEKAKDGEKAKPARDDRGRLEKLMADRKLGLGTPAEEAARFGVGFVQASRDYWAGKGNLERYTKFLDGYVAEAAKLAKEAKGRGDTEWVQRPFLAEAEFDRLFVFASRYYLTAALPPNVQLLSTWGAWQIAFNLPSRGRERFDEYVTRVCRVGKLAEGCKGVPHEDRHVAINKPYIEWQKKRAEELLASKPPKAFATVTERYLKVLDAQLKATPSFEEDPKLPSTYSDRGASTGLKLSMSKKTGVKVHQTVVSEKFNNKVPNGVKKAGAKVIDELKNTPGNQIDFERVVLEMPGDVAAGQLVSAVRAFPRDVVRQFDLVGRRRADESLKRAGLLLRLQPEDKSNTASYEFLGAKQKKCPWIGVTGKPDIGYGGIAGSYLVWDKNKVQGVAAEWDDPEAEKKRRVVKTKPALDTTPKDTKGIQAWLDKNPGKVFMFISGDHSYDELLQAVSSVTHQCHDLEIAVDEFGRELKTFTCGKSKARDISVYLSVCN